MIVLLAFSCVLFRVFSDVRTEEKKMYENGILLAKLFRPTVRKKYYSNGEKVIKIKG